jgi:hypothetical protein
MVLGEISNKIAVEKPGRFRAELDRQARRIVAGIVASFLCLGRKSFVRDGTPERVQPSILRQDILLSK